MKFNEYIRQKKNLGQAVWALQKLQECHPGCSSTTHLPKILHDVSDLEHKRADFHYHRYSSQWTQMGDRCNKTFFETVSPRRKYTGIRQLQKADGNTTCEPKEMRKWQQISTKTCSRRKL